MLSGSLVRKIGGAVDPRRRVLLEIGDEVEERNLHAARLLEEDPAAAPPRHHDDA